MELMQTLRGVALAMGLGVMFACVVAGCGGSSDQGSAPAQIDPEVEKKTQDMVKNLGKTYGEMYRKKAGQ